jgi:hypothetical protein
VVCRPVQWWARGSAWQEPQVVDSLGVRRVWAVGSDRLACSSDTWILLLEAKPELVPAAWWQVE